MAKRDIVAIGGSLGAIEAASTLLAALPAGFPVVVLIVIHVGARGINQLATMLGSECQLAVGTAAEGQTLEPGHVYVAASDHHLVVTGDIIRLGRGPRENLARPAVDPLLRSVAVSYGPRAIGIILSGLLNDGAAGLAAIAQCGGVTAVQTPGEAKAPQMPLGALEAADVDYRDSAAELGTLLLDLVGQDVEPAFTAPADLELEVRIALGRRSDSSTMSIIGDVAALSCPSCGGVLSQMHARSPLRFRCQVGHAFTAKVLAEEQESSVDEAIRTALRIVEERVTLLSKMAAEASEAGRSYTAQQYEERTAELRAHASTLRSAAIGAEPGLGVVPPEGPGAQPRAST